MKYKIVHNIVFKFYVFNEQLNSKIYEVLIK